MKIEIIPKFNLGDKVYYIERDWYLEEVVKHFGNEYTRSCFDTSYKPFEILSVKIVKTKNVWDSTVTERITYNLGFVGNNDVDMRENIEEEDIFFSFDECCKQAVVITENTRWR